MAIVTVLHLVGSPTDAFHRDLSELYARDAIKALAAPARYRFLYVHVSPEGWRLPVSLAARDIAAVQPQPFAHVAADIAALGADVALPQLFCRRGMTECRAALDLLGLPYLGNRPTQMALAADKALARAVVAGAGVAVPDGEVLTAHERTTLAPPVIVKPADLDNSEGLTLVRDDAGMAAAIALALRHSDRAIVERFVPPGREVRCGTLVREGRVRCLPLEEYPVDPTDHPVRTTSDKLARGADGDLRLVAKADGRTRIVASDDPVVAAVHDAALACHRALGLRQYGLFDFRIDPEGRPWFLEAGPYCSFAPGSVLVGMAAASGTSLGALFHEALTEILEGRGEL